MYAKFQLKASSVSRLRPEKSGELNKEYHQTDCSEHCYNYAEYLDVILYLTKKKKKAHHKLTCYSCALPWSEHVQTVDPNSYVENFYDVYIFLHTSGVVTI